MRTRTLVSYLAVVLAVAAIHCGAHPAPGVAAQERESKPAAVPSGEGIEFISPVPNGEWTLPAGDFANTRYSPLNDINADNVASLKVATTMAVGVPNGFEGQPLVVGDTMYVVTPFPNNLIAINLRDPGGPVRWTYQPHPDPKAVGIACCDIVNRGASYADGKIVYNTLDAQTVAVDAATGRELWKTKVGDISIGPTTTMAPLVVKDKVIVGSSGGELGVRGWTAGLDLATGRIVWRAYNTGPDSEVLIGPGFKAFYPKDQGTDLGVTSWPTDQWKLGGANVWGWVSYDPELDLVYFGTGNPGVWNPDLRPGDNKWSSTIFARDPDDGSARWALQLVPHDSWDYDEIMENVLVDMEFNGRMRKLLIHPGRTGFVFVIDRETGELLSSEAFQPVNWASGYNLQTGLPAIDDTKRTHLGKVTEHICPSSTGAKEWVPSSLSPKTGLLYIPAHNTCMNYEAIEANYIAGTPYLGASVKMMPNADMQGELVAWDVAGQRQAWGVKEKWPVYSGVLSTGGDIVFYGTMDGWFKALDSRSGKELWRFKASSGIIGAPITYRGPDGKQYVAVYSGIGGWMGAVALPSVSEDDPYAALGVVGAMRGIKGYSLPGSVLYVFSL
jgi:lanthanide-dependent methanol dehydrogenase